jgi:hypothetical protein
MVSRVKVKGMGTSTPGRRTFKLTSVPAVPRRAATTSSGSQPSTDSPSTSTIWSPARIPILAPGPPGKGVCTVTHPSLGMTSSPTPPYSPSILIRRSWAEDAGRKEELGSPSSRSTPSMADS